MILSSVALWLVGTYYSSPCTGRQQALLRRHGNESLVLDSYGPRAGRKHKKNLVEILLVLALGERTLLVEHGEQPRRLGRSAASISLHFSGACRRPTPMGQIESEGHNYIVMAYIVMADRKSTR